MPAAALRQSQSKKYSAVSALRHLRCKPLQLLMGNSDVEGCREFDSSQQLSNGPDHLEVRVARDPDECVGKTTGCRRFGINHDDVAIRATARNEQPLGIDAVPLEMPRMAFRGIGSPKDDEVRAIADFS